MEKCRRLSVRDGALVGGDAGGCYIWFDTYLLKPKEIAGPCSISTFATCREPRQGEDVVWIGGSDGRIYIYRRSIVEPLLKFVAGAVSEGRPIAVLLAGASRVGKSTLARLALEMLGLPYRVRTSTEFLNQYVGVSEERVANELRSLAENGGGLVIEEVDGMFPSVSRTGGEPEEVVKTRAAFLAAMDELKRGRRPAVLMATTNVDVEAFPPEVRTRFDYIAEFPKPTVAEYEYFARAIGAGERAKELAEEAAAALVGYDSVERCAREGGPPCRFKPELTAIYVRGDVAGYKKKEELIADVEEALPIAFNPAMDTLMFNDEEADRNRDLAPYIILSALAGRPVVLTRGQEELRKAMLSAKYYDVVLAPLPQSADPRDIYAAYRRVPVALVGWGDRGRDIAGNRTYNIERSQLDNMTVDGKPMRAWLKEKIKIVADRLRRWRR